MWIWDDGLRLNLARFAKGGCLKQRIAIADFRWVLPGELDWEDLLAGRSAVVSLPEHFPVSVAAPCPIEPEVPADWQKGLFPRAVGLAHEALQRLGPKKMDRVGLVLGLPNYFAEVPYLEHVLPHGDQPEEMAWVGGFYADAALDFLAKRIPNCGPRVRLDSACATGNDCLAVAHQWLSTGFVSNCVVVAASAMVTPTGLALFKNLKALSLSKSLQASCPFDRRRNGFVMGEGAAAFWLTTDTKWHPRGFLEGYGMRLQAANFIDLPEDLAPMAEACQEALGENDEVAYVSAHGTATQLNDLRETQLHRHLFGERAQEIPMSSVKSMLGHTLGAAALIDAGVCVSALEAGMAPPTINLHEPDPECDLNYLPLQAQPIHGDLALSNAFAFGGQNTSVLIRGTRG